jgi:ElaB/YqjD/DUF883 family membrane-anchored ribosome-binding protein
MSENDFSSQASEVKSHAREVLYRVGGHLSEQANHLRDLASDARYHSEDFIQTNPWPAVALAASLGFIAGVLVSRR